jgi:hypothetical protein
MVMSNGQTQRIQFKARKTATEVRPDAPEGGWNALIQKGKTKVTVTAPDKGGDPVLIVSFQLLEAHDEKNESFNKSVITQRVTFYDVNDAERRKAANMNLQWVRGLCEKLDIDFSKVYPAELNDESDLEPLINAIEGQRLELWTVHRKSVSQSGEEMINVDIRFKKPGSGLATAKKDDEDEESERPAAKRGARRGR